MNFFDNQTLTLPASMRKIHNHSSQKDIDVNEGVADEDDEDDDDEEDEEDDDDDDDEEEVDEEETEEEVTDNEEDSGIAEDSMDNPEKFLKDLKVIDSVSSSDALHNFTNYW